MTDQDIRRIPVRRGLLYGAFAAATIFLIVWHRHHLFDALPFLVVLACPLMHLFMQGTHGHHDGRGPEKRP